jgi:hypothetical protein
MKLINKEKNEFNYEDIECLNNKKLVSYLNKKHSKIISDLYSNKDSNKINHKLSFIQKHSSKSSDEIINLLKNLDKNNDFEYFTNLTLLLLSHNLNEINFQNELEKINEISNERKDNGVYYTPEDITDFIIYNSIFQLIANKYKIDFKPLNPGDIVLKITQLRNNQEIVDFISNISVFDPTCGTGAFLLRTFQIKIEMIQKLNYKLESAQIYDIINNLHGNDLDSYSTYVSKLRILFKCSNLNNKLELDLKEIYSILSLNFRNYNFISQFEEGKTFDMIVGNPPYVERTKTDYMKLMNYGNTYADVMQNSIKLLKSSGILGFIIPLSYVSTARMNSLRKFVEQNTGYQYILNYNDRPDCLFLKVHQKLSIIFCKKNKSKQHNLFTSDYKYWYKKERCNLFLNNDVVFNENQFEEFYSKIGSEMENQIFSKVTGFNRNLISLENKSESSSLFLNKRATFWIKSFIREPYNLNEYKTMKFNKQNMHLANVIFNSSLYWWFWIKISDCWHLTNKELLYFTIPQASDDMLNKIEKLSLKLDLALEETKEEINTKQAMYEYKHKNCKDVIDLIDEELAKIYNLTKLELEFIKNYNEKYRMGRK